MFFYPYLTICLCLIPNEIDCAASEDSLSAIIVYKKSWLQFLNSLPLSTPPLSQARINELSGGYEISKSNQEDYVGKIEELKCVYGGIVQSMLDYTYEVVTKVCTGHVPRDVMNIVEAVPIFKEFQTYIARMFSVLKVANESAFAWMWDVYFVLSMVIENNELGKLIADFQVDVRLITDIAIFTRSCTEKKHPKPTNISIEQHQVAKDMAQILGRGLCDVKLACDHDEWLCTFVYQYADGFELTNMLGTRLMNVQTLIRPPLLEFLKDPLKELNAVWNAPISRFCGNNKVDLVRHHSLIATIVEISVTYDLWAYFSIYYSARETTTLSDLNDNDNSVDLILTPIQEPLRTAAELLGVYADEFYGHLYSEHYAATPARATELLDIVNNAKDHFITLLNSVRAKDITSDDLTRIENSIYMLDDISLARLHLKEYVDKIKEKSGPHIFSLYKLYESSQNNNVNNVGSSDIMAHDKSWLQFLDSLSLPTTELTRIEIDQLLSEDHIMKSKSDHRVDYVGKIEKLKCAYGGIVQSMFDYINEVVSKALSAEHIPSEVMNMYGILEAEPIFKEFQTYMAKMFSVLCVANESAFAWMWDVYFMLNTVIETKDLGKLADQFKVDDRLQTEIAIFIGSCVEKKYLEPIKISIMQHETVTAEKILGRGLLDVKLAHDHNEPPLYTFVYQYVDVFQLSKTLGARLNNVPDLIRPPLVEVLDQFTRGIKRSLEYTC